MKRYTFLLLFCISTLCVLAQNVPVITAISVGDFSITKAEENEWNKYREIIYNIPEENRDEEDKEFVAQFEKENNLDPLDAEHGGQAPWETEQDMGCSWYCGAYYGTSSSSQLANNGKNDYSTDMLHDEDVRTAWIEGAKGYGIGEYIKFSFGYGAPQITSAYLVNGYCKNEQTWKNNSRVKTMNLYQDNDLIAIIKLEDDMGLQIFDFDKPLPVYPTFDREEISYGDPDAPQIDLKFLITEVYKGDKYDDTAISEFYFDGIGVHCLAEGTEITLSNKSEKQIEYISKGDEVLVYDHKEKEFVTRKVTSTYKVTHEKMYRITLSDGKQITTTGDHPFLSPSGWKSIDPEKTKMYARYMTETVETYEVGSELYTYGMSEKSTATVSRIEEINKPTKTYTLELDGIGAFIANDFIVGQE